MPYLRPVELKSFLLGQYFADGVKITLGVLLPSLVFSYWDNFETGLVISLGAFLVSISDSTGPMSHRRTGMLFACLCVFLSALVTGFLNTDRWMLGIQIPVFCFVFAMLTVYGNRAASVGTAALLAMAISIDQYKTSGDTLGYAWGILGGGLWYTGLSLSLMQIRPYRVAQQALGECVLQVAQYLKLKGNFYQSQVDVGENYRKLAKLQISVNEHQDNVRDMLFKARVRVGDSIRSGRILIMIFTDIMDMFEKMMAAHYDYGELRKQYGKYGILQAFDRAIDLVAGELSRLGYALINNERPKKKSSVTEALEAIRTKMDELDRQGVAVLTLRRVYVNLKGISDRLDTMFNYFQEEKIPFISPDRVESLTRFVSHQEFDLKVVRNHFSFESIVFRHALRLSITCLVGYLVALLLPFGQHSYWVVLTIVVILRPGFSLTKRRNYERIMGTFVGGVSGVLILLTVEDYRVRFVILVVLMVLAYSFWRIRYGLSVLFMTPFIFIMYGFIYPDADMLIAQERIIDTVVGSVLAFLASNFLFPRWEYGGLHSHMVQVLQANLGYLKQITYKFDPVHFDETEYRLARKKLYLQTAHLSSAFQRMLDEPKSKQKNKQELHQFVVLNHMLSSYMATLSTSILSKEAILTDPKQLSLIKRSRQHLQKAMENLTGQQQRFPFPALEVTESRPLPPGETDLLTDQLRLIRKTCSDIEKLSAEV